MVLDHIMLKVKSWPTAKVYYEQALAPLGYVLMKDGGTWGGFHNPGDPGSTGRIYVRQGAYLPALADRGSQQIAS